MRIPEPIAASAAMIFRYTISSTEMRHIERAERRIYLGADPGGRPRLWGEVTGCGEACHADLAGLLLEYAMSCEGAPQPQLWEQAARSFTEQTGAAIAAALAGRTPASTPEARARLALEGLVGSMESPSPLESAAGIYGFADCPLCTAAASGGTGRVADRAHDLLLALCRTTVATAAPGFTAAASDDLSRRGHPLRLGLTTGEAP